MSSTTIIESLVEKTNKLHSSPWKVLIALIVLTFLALMSAGKLQINATPYMIGHDHPSRMADHQSKNTFTGTGEQAFIAVVNQQGDVFNDETLTLVKSLSKQFEKMTLVSDLDKQFLSSLSGLTDTQSEKIVSILDKGVSKQDVYQLDGLKNELNNANLLTESEIVAFERLLIRFFN